MTNNEIKKALDILDKFNFFGGQRAGRELWNEKPVDVQNKDIENFVKDVVFLKDLINRQQASLERKKEKVVDLLSKIEELKIINESLKTGRPFLIKTAKAEAYKECMEQLEAEIESSDKYIREYDDSEIQKAHNKGLRDALKALEMVGEDNA